MSMLPTDAMRALTLLSDARTARVSSYDQTGANQDYWTIPPGEAITLADIDGPGAITHIWMTSFCNRIVGPETVANPVLGGHIARPREIHTALGTGWEEQDPFYYRKALIRMTWDRQDHPSVLTPLGDFFGIGHSFPGNYQSAPLNVSLKPEEAGNFGAPCARNSYFQMPFQSNAKIEIINENDIPIGVYFYIDYELYRKPLPKDTLYFHALWKRDNPTKGWGSGIRVNSPEVQTVHNLSGEDNYVILETAGRGHYVGCNLSVTHFQGSWWGEGDDMIFIDGETEPSLAGTGAEDYFGHAWEMQKNSYLYNGSIVHESELPGHQVSYRFHILDPIRFTQSIKVTIEHGHANHLSDDWASTAYWYQSLPSPILEIPPVNARLPYVASFTPVIATHRVILNADQRDALTRTGIRAKSYLAARDEDLEMKIKATRAASKGNIEKAKRIRHQTGI